MRLIGIAWLAYGNHSSPGKSSHTGIVTLRSVCVRACVRVQNGYTRIRVAVRPGTEAATQGLARIFPQADAMMAGYTGTYVEGFEVRDISRPSAVHLHHAYICVRRQSSLGYCDRDRENCP